MRILFLVRSLDLGGAERQLVALSQGLRHRGHEVSIAVFYAGGRFETELRAHQVEVLDLRKHGRWDVLHFMARLVHLVGEMKPDILHSYMEANVFAALLKPLFPGVKLVWGIRSAKSDFSQYGKLARIYPRLERLCAPLPDAVIVNSTAARLRAISNGLAKEKVTVVPNGIDCDVFRPDPEGRVALRGKWGIPEGAILIGIVARLDPVKNHSNFLRAAARVAATRLDAHFICIADSTSSPGYRQALGQLAETLGISDRLTWANEGKVSGAVYSALDVAVLSSNVGESFPNVIGEAMACGKPAVTTDSGDAALIVDDPSAVAAPDDPVALARCMLKALEQVQPGQPFSERLRRRIEGSYSLATLASRTEVALEGVRRGQRLA